MTEREDDFDYGYYDQGYGSIVQLTDHVTRRVAKKEPIGFRVVKKRDKHMVKQGSAYPTDKTVRDELTGRLHASGCNENSASDVAPLVAGMRLGAIFQAVHDELKRASKWPPFNSAHEGHSVMREEFEELWHHVKVNQSKRDLVAMRAEAIQVAAMAIKFVEMIDAGRGRA